MLKRTLPATALAAALFVTACGGGHSDDHDHDHAHSHGDHPIELTAVIDGNQLDMSLTAPATAFGADETEMSAAVIDAQIAGHLGEAGENTNEALSKYYELSEDAGCNVTGASRDISEGEPPAIVTLTLTYECAAIDRLTEAEIELVDVEGFDHIDAIALRGDGQREQHLEGDENILDLR